MVQFRTYNDKTVMVREITMWEPAGTQRKGLPCVGSQKGSNTSHLDAGNKGRGAEAASVLALKDRNDLQVWWGRSGNQCTGNETSKAAQVEKYWLHGGRQEDMKVLSWTGRGWSEMHTGWCGSGCVELYHSCKTWFCRVLFHDAQIWEILYILK